MLEDGRVHEPTEDEDDIERLNSAADAVALAFLFIFGSIFIGIAGGQLVYWFRT